MPLRGFIPGDFQPALPVDRLVARGPRPDGIDEVPMDVLFVGAGPAGLAGAIELARAAAGEPDGPLAGLRIAVLEKAAAVGEHCLSGAVLNPSSLRALFPGMADTQFPFRRAVQSERLYYLTPRRAVRLPVPPEMRNHGCFVVSICELVRWMAVRAEELGVTVLPGYAASALLIDGSAVKGVRTAPAGLLRDGRPGDGHQPSTDITARITVLCEGTRGALTQAWLASECIGSPNPQIYALGVKELWRVRRPVGAVTHTVGWPLPRRTFGGSFVYPVADDRLAVGIVAALDGPHAVDAHALLQQLKLHALLRPQLEGGELVEWGAKTIPEGGLHSLRERLHGDGIMIAGDAAGLVNVASLKGIHHAIQSGVLAARVAADAIRASDVSRERLSRYGALLSGSGVYHDLWRTRHMRLGFKHGSVIGAAIAGLASLTRGRLPAGRMSIKADAAHRRRPGVPASWKPDGRLTFSKLDANFKSGNRTRDDTPLHVLAAPQVPPEVASFYAAMCPAGVYEARDGGLIINPANCIDCKATDVVGPRWLPREGGAGPRYQQM